MADFESTFFAVMALLILFGLVASALYYVARFSIRTDEPTESLPASGQANKDADSLLGAPETSSLPEARDKSVTDLEETPLQPPTVKTVLGATRAHLFERLWAKLASRPRFDEAWEDLEEVLYTSDLGPTAVERLLSGLKARLKGSAPHREELRSAIKEEIFDLLNPKSAVSYGVGGERPHVILIVGVNGAGKTTTIGKLAHHYGATLGLKVLVAAGDTFRAAADAQLRAWTERAAVEIFDPSGVADPSAIAFDACTKAVSQQFDVVLIDTAGRLHTQKNLMEELKKVRRVVQKVVASAPHETLLVLDANSGQNALFQAREFHLALSVTGVVLTKLDGSAKGGVAVGLAQELGLAIKWVGLGEKLTDICPFDSKEYVDAMFD